MSVKTSFRFPYMFERNFLSKQGNPSTKTKFNFVERNEEITMNERISLNPTKFGDIRLPVTIFDAPARAIVVEARITQRRDANNKAIDNSIAKIQFEVVNFELAQTIIKSGGKATDLATIQLEFITDEAIMKNHAPNDLIGKVLDLSDVTVAPKWVSRANSGSWGGFKLICSALKFVPTQPTSAKTSE